MSKKIAITTLIMLFVVLTGITMAGYVEDLDLSLPFSGGDSWWISCGYQDTDPLCWAHASGAKDQYALDFNGADDSGKPILAVAGGTVVKVAYDSDGYGNYIEIDHGYGYSTLYAHLQTTSVEVDDVVVGGQKIGECGSTGSSTNDHLHFAMYYKDANNIKTSIPPEPMSGYINFQGDSVATYTSNNFWNPYTNFTVGKYNDGWRFQDTSSQDFIPYSRPFFVSYFNNGSSDALGYPINTVELFPSSINPYPPGSEYGDTGTVWVQNFERDGKYYSLVLNPHVYNIRFEYLGVAYPIQGQIRNYWMHSTGLFYDNFWKLGAPVTDEYTWSDGNYTYSVQWFERTENNYFCVAYNRQTGTITHGTSEELGIPIDDFYFNQAVEKNCGCPESDCGSGGGLDSPVIEAALIIDSSGSMQWNDPNNLRKEAAKIFVDTANDDDQLAIIDFDSYSKTLWPLQPLSSDRAGIKHAINLIDSIGGTSISAGLLEAYNELISSNLPRKKAAVLLTDGQGSYYDEAFLYSQKGWPIFTIGLGYSTDVNLLTKIANDTGGQYFALSDPNQLQNVYFEIATQIIGGSSLASTSTNMATGQNFNTSVTVPENQQTTTFLTNWPGSDVSTTLISPTGQVIDANTNDPEIYYAKGITYELFKITNPEAGDWSINVYGVDLAAGGEVVSVNVSTVGKPIPVDNTPPIINISNPIHNKMYSNQIPVTFSFVIEDPESGISAQSVLLNGSHINNNDAIILNKLGENTLTITATNQVNLTNELTINFNVCDFQWLSPIKYEKKSTVETETLAVKSNRTYPIKFKIEDSNGGFIFDSSVKVVVEGTTAEFYHGETDTDVRINEFEDDGEPNYIVNLHTNFKKWDYGLESGNEYFINVYFNNILAGKTKILVK